MHVHRDVEEVFFTLKGSIKLFLEQDGKQYVTRLGERDLVSIPPGVYRGLCNTGQEEALLLVMLGSGKPQIPTYPDDHPLASLKRS